MEKTKKAAILLEKIGKIERMERGKICQMKGRKHFNHQTWHEGRNVVRYVPAKEVEILQSDINGYDQFMDLVQQYAEEIIRITRREREKQLSKLKK